jgi:hypothetical protein
MPHVQEQWKDWYSGDTDPDIYVGGKGNFWLNTGTKDVWEKTDQFVWTYRGKLFDGQFGYGFKEITFEPTDWTGNRITVIPTGTPTSPGEIGPHLIPPRRLYTTVSELSISRYREVGLDIQFDFTTGYITIYKAAKVPAFGGVVAIRFLPS